MALFVAFFTKTLSNFKFKVFHNLIEKEKTGEIVYGVAFLFFISCNCLFVVIAWLFVYIEPLAAGSGIPEIKCFLNGLNIPRVVRVKTLMYVTLNSTERMNEFNYWCTEINLLCVYFIILEIFKFKFFVFQLNGIN